MSRAEITGKPTQFSVTVVIPLYNKEKYIGDTIGCVFRQTRLPDEIVIVDDGSTDDSAVRAQRALGFGPPIRCKFLSQKNRGVSAARNAGADAAGSLYVAFLDADDEWLPGYLAEVEKLALTFPKATVLTTRNAVWSCAGFAVPEPITLPDNFFGIVDRPLIHLRRGRGLIHSSSVTIRKDAWERSVQFPVGARQGEDLFLWLMLCLSETVAHSATPLSIFHSEHSEGESRKDVVGYHFSYFLGTADGRAHLQNEDLRHFLAWHLLRRTYFRRLAGHSEIQSKVRRLAQSLPLASMIACWVVSLAPLSLLRARRWLRDRARRKPAIQHQEGQDALQALSIDSREDIRRAKHGHKRPKTSCGAKL